MKYMMVNEDGIRWNFSLPIRGNFMSRIYPYTLKQALAYEAWLEIKLNVLFNDASVVKLSETDFVVNYDTRLQ